MTGWWMLSAVDLGRVSRQAQRYGSVGDHWFLLTVVAGIGLLWAGLYYWDKYRKQLQGNGSGPSGLFQELCNVHELSRVERGLLLQAAENGKLTQPALAFVDPQVLEDMGRAAGPDSLAYSHLARKLFGNADC